MAKLEKVEVNKFRALLKEMYRGYPNYIYYGMIEKVLTTENMRKHLLDNNVLVKDNYMDKEGNKKEGYSLGINALPLISAWKTEELTDKIKFLTIIMVVIGVITLIAVIMQIILALY